MTTIDHLLTFAEQLVYESTGEHFNDLQRLVLRESWQDPKKTYEQIAVEHNYSGNYIQQVVAPRLWRLLSEVMGEKVTKFNLRSVIERRQTAKSCCSHVPLEAQKSYLTEMADLPLDEPIDSVPIGSRFYVQRSTQEALCFQRILQPNALIRVKGPRQMGKTSLMLRILAHAKAKDIQAVTLNFQQVDKSILADLNKLLRWFCSCVSQKLKLTSQLADYWDDDIGSKMSCTLYMEGHILETIDAPLVLALEEISELFDYPAIAQEFLTMLRSWHEQSKIDETWQYLRLILVQSTENYINLNVNQSPFNVGMEVALTPFSIEQVTDLANRHRLHLRDRQIEQLMSFIQGHPYLTRCLFYQLAQFNHDFDTIMATSMTDAGIYHQHLHRHLGYLKQYPQLEAAFHQVLQTDAPVELEQIIAFRLHSLGLVTLSGNSATIACDLYRQYFNRSSY